jgi:hypothetical protein
MAVAALYNIPTTPQELAQWAFAHAAHHRDLIAKIYLDTAVKLEEFVLDPFNPADLGVWSYQHQQMHNDLDAALGLSGYNLVDVDWRDRGQLAGWIYLNAAAHRQAADILGVG